MDGELVLVRHGQSQGNLENRFTGWTDSPLTETGIAEARHAGELLKGVHFDHAFTSALRRAQETLRLILTVTGQIDLPIEQSAALNERDYGDLQGLNKDETARKFGAEQVHLWRRSYDVAPPNGESLKATRARVEAYYAAHILPLLEQGQKVLVVAHGSSLRALVMGLEQISEQEIPNLEIPTGAPLRYRIDAGGKVIGARANVSLRNFLWLAAYSGLKSKQNTEAISMAFLGIRKLDDAPILITTYTGKIVVEDVDASDLAASQLFPLIHEDAIFIIDATGCTSSFGEVVQILKHGSPAENARDFPFAVQPFLVGTDSMAKLYVDAARQKQFGGQQIPMFASLDAAIAAARQRLGSKHVAS